MLNFVHPRHQRLRQHQRVWLSFTVLAFATCLGVVVYPSAPPPDPIASENAQIYATTMPPASQARVVVENAKLTSEIKQGAIEQSDSLINVNAEQVADKFDLCATIEPPQARILATFFHYSPPFLVIQTSSASLHKIYRGERFGATNWTLQHLESEHLIWHHSPSNCHHLSPLTELALMPTILSNDTPSDVSEIEGGG